MLFVFFKKRKTKHRRLLCFFRLMVILSINTFLFVFLINQSKNIVATQSLVTERKDNSSHWKKKNIVYIKVPKVGGSTFAGVVRRAATKLNLSGTNGGYDWIDNEPGLWAVHTEYKMLKSKIDKLKEATFLTTMIRSPENRALSAFYYFAIWKLKRGDTDDNIINFLKKQKDDFILNYISNYSDSVSPNQVCDGLYDLIGVTERFDESILVLKHMLNIPSLEDILYLAAKNSTSNSNRVTSKLYDDQSETVKAYIDTVFMEHNKKDMELYQLANQRLDEYIKSIPGFHNELMILRSMLKTANEKCGIHQKNVTDCYWNDNGCGIKCLNEINVTDHTPPVASSMYLSIW